jgi:molybdenum cofactor guanylyltransferase
MGNPAEISGFVLAGGRSSRLGRDKALLPWPPESSEDGCRQTLLQHAVARLEMVCTTVSVCANRNDLPFAGAVVPDVLPGSGPLGGIVAALESSMTDWNLMLAVDLPLLPVEVLRALVARAAAQFGAISSVPAAHRVRCILPQLDGLPQPLCGLYHRALLRGLRSALEAGKFKVMAALQEACDQAEPSSDLQSASRAHCVESWDARAFAAAQPSVPNPSEWFLNINTLQDWEHARQLHFR